MESKILGSSKLFYKKFSKITSQQYLYLLYNRCNQKKGNTMNTLIKAGQDYKWNNNTMIISCNFNMNCNLKCSYCINQNTRKEFNEELSPTALYNLFSSLPLLKKDMYTFSIFGGEPSLYTYFPDVLKYMKEFIPANKLRATWMTNGSLLHKLEEYFKDYQEFNFNILITLHLEQINIDTYIKKLAQFKYPKMCTITFILEPGKLNETLLIIKKIQKLGYDKFFVKPIIIDPKIYPNYTKEELQFLTTSPYSSQTILFNEYMTEKQPDKKKFTQIEYLCNPDLINYQGLKCLAGYNSIVVFPDGTITQCQRTKKIPDFNLNTNSLLEYIYIYIDP